MAKSPLLVGIAKPMISAPKTPPAAQPIKPMVAPTSAPKTPPRVAARPVGRKAIQPVVLGGRKRNY